MTNNETKRGLRNNRVIYYVRNILIINIPKHMRRMKKGIRMNV